MDTVKENRSYIEKWLLKNPLRVCSRRRPRLAIGLLLVFAASMVPVRTEHSANPTTLRGDPNFQLEALSQTMQLWHTRMTDAMNSSRSVIEGSRRFTSGDTYKLGRESGNYTAALLLALRGTGDLQFLDRVGELWDLARQDLKDEWCDGTSDGYLNWLWLQSASNYNCKDIHSMDESMVHGVVALVAHAFHVNRDLKPEYSEKADFWLDYLENHFLAKWTERAGGDPVKAWTTEGTGFFKRLRHPTAHQLRLAHYLYGITGNSFYKERADYILNLLTNNLELNPLVPDAYQWKHQVSGSDNGWQKVNYAQYVLRVFIEMYSEGLDVYSQDSEMTRYMSTLRDVVFTKFGSPWVEMAHRVDGSETTSFKMYGLGAYALWDSTELLAQLSELLYSPDSIGTGVDIAGSMLFVLGHPLRVNSAEPPSETPPPTASITSPN